MGITQKIIYGRDLRNGRISITDLAPGMYVVFIQIGNSPIKIVRFIKIEQNAH